MEIALLYAPMLASVGLIATACFATFGQPKPFIELSKWGFQAAISNTMAARATFFAGGLIFLAYYLYMDFSKFFPPHLEMAVFYDEKNLENSLGVFSEDELLHLGVRPENYHLAKSYYEDVDRMLMEELRVDGIFSLSQPDVHSKGETSFKVSKTKGIHKYYIEESRGRLDHIYERPGKPPVTFISFFDKIPSASDYIRPSVYDIIVKHSIILSPRFKQVLAERYKSDGVIFHHVLVAVTKVYLFPFPDFSNTVYFYESPNGLVPIAYAEYKY